jgi:hypothetical protein
MRRAMDLLPLEMRPFFIDHRDELVMRVNDPDLWRVAGFDDDTNHFMNFGMPELGADPFMALPRDLDAAIEKFGQPFLKRLGQLPWRESEEFGNLRRAFEGVARGAPFAAGNAVLFAAVASHYIQDACQPLHASNNYDGQLTNQRGVHARFETALFERFESRLTVAAARASPITHPRDAAFDACAHCGSLRKVGRPACSHAPQSSGAGISFSPHWHSSNTPGSFSPTVRGQAACSRWLAS